ncbi:MAG: bifunctional riboflavin kinase/FAD synthetase [Chloroflexi bacterium]|nr:bifunctional riboflavin kinase/FAD synthetase [Chloroflexota bacterium]
MLVEEELAQISPAKDTLLTIGVFDGVHLGHKYLIAQLVQRARHLDLLSGVITFRQHPQQVLTGSGLSRLTSLEQRIALIKFEGVDFVLALSFTQELSRLTAGEFIGLLKKHLRMRGLVVGPDFTFGHKREGNIDRMRELGRDMNFSLTVISPIMLDGDVASSSAIRQALAEGDVDKARRLLGRRFSLSGRVVSGSGRGRQLGFPTANLAVDPEQALPADGIYATLAHIGDKTYQSVTSIGRRPTFDNGERTVEVYIFDFSGNLYGYELTIDIIKRLREEKRFDSVQQLKEQIEKDIEQSKGILSSESN